MRAHKGSETSGRPLLWASLGTIFVIGGGDASNQIFSAKQSPPCAILRFRLPEGALGHCLRARLRCDQRAQQAGTAEGNTEHRRG